MNIDQRLHRAAHELREIPVDVPPLEVGRVRRGTSLRRLGAPVATVMLFAVGALATAGEVLPAATAGGQVASEIDAVDDAPDQVTVDENSIRQLSPLEELAMITSLRPPESAARPSTNDDPSIPPGAS